MRLPEDEDMAAKNKAPDVVDMIFGGHDHCYARKLNQETGVFIQKSGTDFECFTNLTVLFGVDQSDHDSYMTQLKDEMPNNVKKGIIEVFYNPELKRMFISERVNVTRKFAPVKEISLHVESYANQLREMQDRTALISEVQFEGRFSRVRTQETNLGNFMADLIRTEFQADFGLYNGGGLRANSVFDAGALPFRFISQVLPNEDKIVKLSLQGRLFKQVLENGVSLYPKYDGRWPVISGIHFSFDPTQDAGSRIIEDTMKDDEGQQIEMDKTYTVALMQFFTAGKDGNEALLDPSVVNHCPDMDDAPTI
jgi:5'-nucleotidase